MTYETNKSLENMLEEIKQKVKKWKQLNLINGIKPNKAWVIRKFHRWIFMYKFS